MQVIFESETHKITIPDGAVINAPKIIRFLTVRAFLKRFDKGDRVFLRKTPDDDLIDMMEDLDRAAYVDLKDPELISGITQVTLLPQISSDPLVLLADGQPHEAYNGIL